MYFEKQQCLVDFVRRNPSGRWWPLVSLTGSQRYDPSLLVPVGSAGLRRLVLLVEVSTANVMGEGKQPAVLTLSRDAQHGWFPF